MPFLILAGTMALLGAQAPLVFPTTTELVKVVVSVTDASGQPVRGLTSKDFAVREDGKTRSIATLTPCADRCGEPLPDCPADLVLLIDTSASMLEDLRRARDAAVQFVESVPAARGRNIVAFDSEIRAFDLAHRGAVEALDEILDQGEGRGTRLFTAVMRAIPLASVDPRGAVDLKSQFALIRNDIAAQYVLGFAPASSPPGRTHKLEIKVASTNAKVRHRLAYTTTSRVQGPDTR